MYLVKTKLAPSALHGLGVFAEEFIPKGTVVWQFDPTLDHVFTEEEIASLPVMTQEYIRHHGYFSQHLGKQVMPFDNERFTNHSTNPTVGEDVTRKAELEPVSVALRDINPGEEITVDYRAIEGPHRKRRNGWEQMDNNPA